MIQDVRFQPLPIPNLDSKLLGHPIPSRNRKASAVRICRRRPVLPTCTPFILLLLCCLPKIQEPLRKPNQQLHQHLPQLQSRVPLEPWTRHVAPTSACHRAAIKTLVATSQASSLSQYACVYMCIYTNAYMYLNCMYTVHRLSTVYIYI